MTIATAPAAPNGPGHPFFSSNHVPVPPIAYAPEGSAQRITPVFRRANGEQITDPNAAQAPDVTPNEAVAPETSLAERVDNDPDRLARIAEIAADYRKQWGMEDTSKQAAALGVAQVVDHNPAEFDVLALVPTEPETTASPSDEASESTEPVAPGFELQTIPTQEVAIIDVPELPARPTWDTEATRELAEVKPNVIDEPTVNLTDAVIALSQRHADVYATPTPGPDGEQVQQSNVVSLDELFAGSPDTHEPLNQVNVRRRLAAVGVGVIVFGLATYGIYSKLVNLIPAINVGGGAHN